MGQTITLTAQDGHRLTAWRTGPENARAGIVVIQEIFGVNHHIRNMCEKIAAEGYAVIAPALFDRTEPQAELGYTPEDVKQGIALRGRLDNHQVMLDVDAAAHALGSRTLGITGYCFGGTVAWWGATRSNRFAAASGWYGGGVAGTRTERPMCPVQLHFGEKDTGIPLTDVEAIRAAQPGIEVYVYQGAQHGFGCDERASFSAPDAALAHERTFAFFKQHLGK